MNIRKYDLLAYGVPTLCVFLLGLAVVIMRESQDVDDDRVESLLLLCDESLRPPIEDIIQAFKRRSGVGEIQVRYAATHILLSQLKLAEEGDVFLADDSLYVDEADKLGLISDSRVIAYFIPVIQVARGNPKEINSIEELAMSDVRLVIADEGESAIGRVTHEILRVNGLSMNEINHDTAFAGLTASELSQSVALGYVDAAIVWRAVAFQYPLTEIIEIPPDRNVISLIEVAVLKNARYPEIARKFLRFLSGPAAYEIFRRYNYNVDIDFGDTVKKPILAA